jgi:four helix bundle protein
MSMTPEILLKRLTIFANECRTLTIKLSKSSFNIAYINQIIRSSSSPGANYIEAIDASSSKEFALRLKICRKEIKESSYWLTLINDSNKLGAEESTSLNALLKESDELVKIFTASIITSERNQKIQKMNK